MTFASRRGRREAAKLVAGLLLVSAILYGQRVYGAATAGGRLDPALRDADRPVDVVAVLDFPPERFHQERLALYGVFAGRDGAPNRIRLRQVTPDRLAALAGTPWIARIEPKR